MKRAPFYAVLVMCALPAACQRNEVIDHVVNADVSQTKAPERSRLEFDANTVMTVSGRVASVEALQHMGRARTGVRVLLHTPAETFWVYLGPAHFLERHGLAVAEGDEMQVTGSVVETDGRRAIIATGLTKSGLHMSLRNTDGRPEWWRVAGLS